MLTTKKNILLAALALAALGVAPLAARADQMAPTKLTCKTGMHAMKMSGKAMCVPVCKAGTHLTTTKPYKCVATKPHPMGSMKPHPMGSMKPHPMGSMKPTATP